MDLLTNSVDEFKQGLSLWTFYRNLFDEFKQEDIMHSTKSMGTLAVPNLFHW